MTRINVHRNPTYIGGSAERHGELSYQIEASINRTLLKDGLDEIDVYRLDENPYEWNKHSYQVGNEKRLVIFLNRSIVDSNKTVTEIDEQQFTAYTPIDESSLNSYMTFKDPFNNSQLVAIYEENYNQLTFPIDLFQDDTLISGVIFTHVLHQINEKVQSKRKYLKSWKHTSRKDQLIEDVKKSIEEHANQEINNLKGYINSYERRIEDYRRDLKSTYDSLIVKRKQVEALEKDKVSIDESFVKQLDSIIALDKVSDLVIDKNKYILYTNDLFCQHDTEDELYYIGKFCITINMKNSDICFENLNNKRRNYWGSEGNAPHVDESGQACLGNVAATIAELCSQNEIYALSLVAIDFLESVNTDDAAGAYINSWDMVNLNDDGTFDIIRKAEALKVCYICEEHYPESAMNDFYYELRELEDGSHNTEDYDMDLVCDDCRCDCEYVDDVEAYVREYHEYDVTTDPNKKYVDYMEEYVDVDEETFSLYEEVITDEEGTSVYEVGSRLGFITEEYADGEGFYYVEAISAYAVEHIRLEKEVEESA